MWQRKQLPPHLTWQLAIECAAVICMQRKRDREWKWKRGRGPSVTCIGRSFKRVLGWTKGALGWICGSYSRRCNCNFNASLSSVSHTHTHTESTENCAGLFARFVKQFVCSVTRTLCRRREREQLIALVDCLITGCPHPSPSLFYPLVCLLLRLSLHKWQCIRQTFVQNTRHLVSLWAWQPRNQLGVH